MGLSNKPKKKKGGFKFVKNTSHRTFFPEIVDDEDDEDEPEKKSKSKVMQISVSLSKDTQFKARKDSNASDVSDGGEQKKNQFSFVERATQTKNNALKVLVNNGLG